MATTLLSFALKVGVGGRRRRAVCPSPSASAACVRQRRMKGGRKVGRWSPCWRSGREVARRRMRVGSGGTMAGCGLIR